MNAPYLLELLQQIFPYLPTFPRQNLLETVSNLPKCRRTSHRHVKLALSLISYRTTGAKSYSHMRSQARLSYAAPPLKRNSTSPRRNHTAMLYRIRNQAARTLFNFSCRRILETPPLLVKDAPLMICSMLCRRDLIMYLLAIKSLYIHLGEGRICIIDDGSLDDSCVRTLKHHLCEPEIISIKHISTDSCPQGGCWERLLFVLDRSADHYVIQADSDILIRSAIPEVLSHYRENRSFTLGTPTGSAIKPAKECADFAKTRTSSQIQLAAEASLSRLPNAAFRNYVRGCAAFTGFAKNSMNRADAINFSKTMQGLLGTRWAEWGSEQVTSNYLIANSPNSAILPIHKYINYLPPFYTENSALIHFLGEYRFQHAAYLKEGRRQIKKMLGFYPSTTSKA